MLCFVKSIFVWHNACVAYNYSSERPDFIYPVLYLPDIFLYSINYTWSLNSLCPFTVFGVLHPNMSFFDPMSCGNLIGLGVEEIMQISVDWLARGRVLIDLTVASFWLYCKPKSGSEVLFVVPQMGERQRCKKTWKGRGWMDIEYLILESFYLCYESYLILWCSHWEYRVIPF